jgi:hypothetical protein
MFWDGMITNKLEIPDECGMKINTHSILFFIVAVDFFVIFDYSFYKKYCYNLFYYQIKFKYTL